MNQIATRTAGASALAALSSLKSGLQNVQSTIVSRGGDPFLRLQTDGEWVYGAENISVEAGSRWAVNPMSLQHGWVAWTDHPGKQANEVVGEVMVPMTSPLPPQASLNDVGWDWAQQLQITLLCVSGEDKGEQVLYKTTSVGGTGAVKALIGEIMKRLDIDPDNPVPVVELETSHYIHKKWGKTYTPVFTIRQWVALSDELPEVTEDKAEPATPEPAKPAPRTRKATGSTEQQKPDPAKTDEPEDELAAMERRIAEMKAAKAAQAAQAEDPAAKRKRELEAELAALQADTQQAAPQTSGQAEAGAQPQPLRRRRNA